MGGHALVFGASGITGWGAVNALLSDYPTPDAFDRVTALTNRPLPVEESGWPASKKLNVVSGLDLLSGDQAALEESIRQQVPQIETVSHVYFFAYIYNADSETEIQINVDLLKRAITAVDSLSGKLAFVVLPTGVKTYGVHLLDKFPFADKLPLSESLPPIPEPFKSKLFYYPQVELLQQLSATKTWKWCDVIPDIVVGFVPNNNAYCLAQWLALYLSLYRELNGPGAEVVFPGTKSWTIKSNDSNQDIIGRFAVYASLHPEWSAGERYNVADNATYSSWEVRWPIICDYFGLKGVAPTNGPGPDPSVYIHENRERWFELERKYGLKGGRVGNEKSLTIVSNFLMNQFDFDRQIDLTKMHRAWGDAKEETDVQGAWHVAFDRFRAANIIPKAFT
ncbi:SDR family oxidoreductase [Aspergillus mulundensis]|uniref:PRISE-like Rossmann-fold domain-containing protein n=1 Tax=Aspergillus mulundensis TaxID=1810919 RepID=A0A3D8QVU4_9EURO|nr:Uncharacterized protein DSM5745_09373 [Aspergillus mulundensis]RDW65634.1 Uncharacterized protein DSM5745_09373 [Aspergillus mulundensis]